MEHQEGSYAILFLSSRSLKIIYGQQILSVRFQKKWGGQEGTPFLSIIDLYNPELYFFMNK